jgi:hypothetical protein
MLDITQEQMRRMETAEMSFLRPVAGYRIIDHKHNENIREEFEITDEHVIQS